MSGFDRRVTPARPDLAAAHLKGAVAAERYAEGRTMRVVRGTVPLRANPSHDAGMETQLLFGESFTVYEEKDGWAWGQAASDSYVGYTEAVVLSAASGAPAHRVTALSTPLLSAPDVKKAARDLLPMNASVVVEEESDRFHRVQGGLFVFAGHLAPLPFAASDWTGVAERFIGAPYLWGGKTSHGLDCSGLVQTALQASGMDVPRDTDMMERALGQTLALDAPLRRGDLIFWKGHVGVMLDAQRLLHANAYAMQVSVEPLAAARDRIAAREGLPVRTIKRL